jgi:hypothetical protein
VTVFSCNVAVTMLAVGSSWIMTMISVRPSADRVTLFRVNVTVFNAVPTTTHSVSSVSQPGTTLSTGEVTMVGGPVGEKASCGISSLHA